MAMTMPQPHDPWHRPLRFADLAEADRQELEALVSDLAAWQAKHQEALKAHWRAVVTLEQLDNADAERAKYLETEAHRGNTDELGWLNDASEHARSEYETANALDAESRGTIGGVPSTELRVMERREALVEWLGAWYARTAPGREA